MNILSGQKISFRSSDHIDFELYSKWINFFEGNKFLVSARFPQTVERLKEYVDSHNSSSKVIYSLFHNDQYIGNISLSSVDWLSRRAEVGLFIGDASCRGKGFGFDALEVLVSHCFNQFNLFKITAGVFEGNDASLSLFKKIGFTIEGEFKDHYFLDGKYVSEYRLALFNRNFIQ